MPKSKGTTAARLTRLLDEEGDAPPWSRGEAHLLAGVAGMLGFARLAELSRSAMEEDLPAPSPVLRDAATRALATTSHLLFLRQAP